MSPRSYQQSARAATRDLTQQRILDAAIALYTEVGPMATTISAVAERAGVQRLTVYRHFLDGDALFAGCARRWRSTHGMPGDRWSTIGDPRQRLRVALDSLYVYYAGAEPMLTQLMRERDRAPAARAWLEPLESALARMRAQLADGWGLTGRPRAWVEALVAHVVSVATWRSLVRDTGLTPSDAARLMARSVADLARDPYA